MPLVDNVKPNSRFLGLFIGPSGGGKSTAAYTFPKPMKIFDTDGRWRGGIQPWTDTKDLEYESFPPRPNGETNFSMLNKAFEILDIQCRTNTNRFKSIVVDSITWEAVSLLLDSTGLTKGKKIAGADISGPADYQFQSSGIYNILAFLAGLPIENIIVTGHVVNKYGKETVTDKNGIETQDAYGPSVIVGEQLALTDKLAEIVPGRFDHVFKFEKKDTGQKETYKFSCRGSMARSAYPLTQLPYGQMDVTGIDFYKFLQSKIAPAAAPGPVLVGQK